jgi:hypothetical protein
MRGSVISMIAKYLITIVVLLIVGAYANSVSPAFTILLLAAAVFVFWRLSVRLVRRVRPVRAR